jgi:hypothetical protein
MSCPFIARLPLIFPESDQGFWRFFGIFLALLVFASPACASEEFVLDEAFRHHAVFQCEEPVRAGGRSNPLDEIKVEFSGQEQTVQSQADEKLNTPAELAWQWVEMEAIH